MQTTSRQNACRALQATGAVSLGYGISTLQRCCVPQASIAQLGCLKRLHAEAALTGIYLGGNLKMIVLYAPEVHTVQPLIPNLK